MRSPISMVIIPLVLLWTTEGRTASATSYGFVRVAHVIATDIDHARQSALEACATNDKSCALISACSAPGYGAAAVSRAGGVIVSIGSVCAQPDLSAAMGESLRLCAIHANGLQCQIEQVWQDR